MQAGAYPDRMKTKDSRPALPPGPLLVQPGLVPDLHPPSQVLDVVTGRTSFAVIWNENGQVLAGKVRAEATMFDLAGVAT